MGIRCDQHMGLSKAAIKIVGGNRVLHHTDVTTRTYPDGRTETIGPMEAWGSDVECRESGGTYTGMFGDAYELLEYRFPDGRVLREAVQANPWSSGSCFFLALKDEGGAWVSESLWTEAEIGRA